MNMKGIAITMTLILIGIILLRPSRKYYNTQKEIEEESYGDMIAQETLKHL